MKNVLIAGASGLIGKKLTSKLQESGYRVFSLSHSLPTNKSRDRFHWNPATGFIEEGCFDEIDHVINLAGVGVFDHSWSNAYKAEIIKSRISSTLLLKEYLRSSLRVKTFVNASAIGIYGADTKNRWVDENSLLGDDFLAKVVQEWEHAFFTSSIGNIRRVALRVGIVLSPNGGALPQLMKPIKYYVGSPLASGEQFISWIHIDDVCAQFIWAMEETSAAGSYNAVAPTPLTNKELTTAIAAFCHRPLWLPNIPAIVLKLLLGTEKAETLIGGNRVSSSKIMNEGYRFKYKTLHEALHSFFRTN